MWVQACWGAAPGALPARDAAVAVLEGMGVLDDSASDDPYATYLLNTPLTLADAWTAVFGHVDKVKQRAVSSLSQPRPFISRGLSIAFFLQVS